MWRVPYGGLFFPYLLLLSSTFSRVWLLVWVFPFLSSPSSSSSRFGQCVEGILGVYKLSAWSINSRRVLGVLLASSTMNVDWGQTLSRSAGKVIFSSWSYTIIRMFLHDMMSLHKISNTGQTISISKCGSKICSKNIKVTVQIVNIQKVPWPCMIEHHHHIISYYIMSEHYIKTETMFNLIVGLCYPQ